MVERSLVHAERLDGAGRHGEGGLDALMSGELTPSHPDFIVPAKPGRLGVFSTYLQLGVEHILTGVDHLLFVLALLFLVGNWRRLIATVTAFTVAHSITLAAATLGLSVREFLGELQQPRPAIGALERLRMPAREIRFRNPVP
jgi:hypothetical protein